MQIVHSENYKDHTIEVSLDEFANDPRGDFEPFGKMICFHKRYELGDEHTELYEQDEQYFQQWINKQSKAGNIIAYPIYMMDHSGISISISKDWFLACDPQCWDHGLLGYIYVTKDKVRKEYSLKSVSKKMKTLVEDILKFEVNTYNNYISGNVYGYIIKNPLGKIIDSCWGFYGSYDQSGLIDQAKEFVDFISGD